MVENRKSERLLWVDILKGLLILSVVIGHATGKYNRYIYQFHIAAFFMASGYTANYSRENLSVFIYHRFVRLMLPFLSVFVFGVALSCFLMKTGTYHWLFPEDQIYIGVRSMIKELILRGNNYVWWMGACWYLSVLFGALCVQAVFHCGVKNDRWLAVGTFLTFFYALSVEWMGNISVFPVKLVLIAQGYLFVGEMARKHSIVDTIVSWGTKRCCLLALVLLVVFGYVGEKAGITMDWPSNRFSLPWQMLVIPICDTLLFCLISKSLEKWGHRFGKAIAFLGKNSLSILIFHFLWFKAGNAIMVLCRVIPLEQINSFLPPKPEAESFWPVYTLIACCGSILLWKTICRFGMMRVILGQDKGLYEKAIGDTVCVKRRIEQCLRKVLVVRRKE